MSKQVLTIGFSPCPNDTFIFDALVHHKIDTEGLSFDPVIEDVETLNRKVINHELDISKISFAAYLPVSAFYRILNAGSALGKGVGPLLVSTGEKAVRWKGDAGESVIIPGKNTTANFLFSIFYPLVKNKGEMIFSAIEDALLSGQADAGVLIHEGRFTFAQKGLLKICDLGDLWEKETGLPIPLGGIVADRRLPSEVLHKVDRVIRRSVEFALSNPLSGFDYVKQHAQEMDEAVRQKHISLYVNNFSVHLGEEGRQAIEALFTRAKENGLIAELPENIFVDQRIESC